MTTLVKVEAVWTTESQQAIFRALLNALSFPGRLQDITTPLDGGRTELGILAALVDERVTIADPDEMLSSAERRLLAPGALVAPVAAEYVLLDGGKRPDPAFKPNLGTIYRPEEGAMLILRVGRLTAQSGEGTARVHLTGPGVATEQTFTVSGLHTEWLMARNQWCDNFPTGCDLILCADNVIVGVPRTATLRFDEEGA